MWIEIIEFDGNRGLINLDNVIDIWMANGSEYATILQVNGDEVEIASSDFERIKQMLLNNNMLKR